MVPNQDLTQSYVSISPTADVSISRVSLNSQIQLTPSNIVVMFVSTSLECYPITRGIACTWYTSRKLETLPSEEVCL